MMKMVNNDHNDFGGESVGQEQELAMLYVAGELPLREAQEVQRRRLADHAFAALVMDAEWADAQFARQLDGFGNTTGDTTGQPSAARATAAHIAAENRAAQNAARAINDWAVRRLVYNSAPVASIFRPVPGWLKTVGVAAVVMVGFMLYLAREEEPTPGPIAQADTPVSIYNVLSTDEYASSNLTAFDEQLEAAQLFTPIDLK